MAVAVSAEPAVAGAFPPADAARVGMAVFLAAEAMLFAGFVTAFLVFRFGAAAWPPPAQPRLPVEVTGANTVVLLLSAVTMRWAVRAARAGRRAALTEGLALTALFGASFLAVQGYEWLALLRFGLSATSGVYGGIFYAVVGAHALHVAAAVAWLCGLLAARAVRPAPVGLADSRVPVFALYWYFVVGLWPFLYALVYLA